RKLRLPQRRGDVAAVDGGDVGGGAVGQRVVQEGLSYILRRHFLAEEVARHVFLFRNAARAGAARDHLVGQQAGADAVGVDGVGADAVGAVVERVLPRQEQRRSLGQAVGAEFRAGVDRLL